jgi:hypothetical protein
MIIKMSVDNVVQMWSLIKYAAAKVSGLDDKHVPKYISGVLKDLMCEKMQCWANVNESREVVALALTRIQIKTPGIPYILIEGAYGFSPSSDQSKEEFIDIIEKFAKSTGCVAVVALTTNQLAMNAMQKMGMKEKYRVFEKEVR